MQVKDIVAKAPVDEITIKVTDKGEIRDVRGGSLKVCDCNAEDETGSIKLTLWNDDIEKVNVGDMVTIKKGWVNEFQGEKSLSAGRFGEMTIAKGDAPAEKSKQPKEVLDAVEDDII